MARKTKPLTGADGLPWNASGMPVAPTSRKTPKSYARKLDQAIKALNLIDRLRERACGILLAMPQPHAMDDDEFSRLTVDIEPDKSEVVIKIVGLLHDYYESATLEVDEYRVPVRLLFCPPDELETWRLQEWAAYNRKNEEGVKAAETERLERERRLYEALKAKFELEESLASPRSS